MKSKKRFSLLTLFLIVTVLALSLGLILNHREARRQLAHERSKRQELYNRYTGLAQRTGQIIGQLDPGTVYARSLDSYGPMRFSYRVAIPKHFHNIELSLEQDSETLTSSVLLIEPISDPEFHAHPTHHIIEIVFSLRALERGWQFETWLVPEARFLPGVSGPRGESGPINGDQFAWLTDDPDFDSNPTLSTSLGRLYTCKSGETISLQKMHTAEEPARFMELILQPEESNDN